MAADVFGLVGTIVAGTYRVDAVVAEGGFGVVYRAFHSGFRAPVALKCLKIPERFGPEQQSAFLEQFREEAELMFRLSSNNPTVVRPLHIDALISPAGRFVPFIALEWLEGLTLDRVVEQRKAKGLGPPSLRKLVALLTPVARALERAHRFVGPEGPMPVAHRDVKPENVFIATVNDEQVPKILDFGIATARSVASQVGGAAPELAGSFTPAFGAPEQWAPHKFGPTGPWTDVWGLALTLVEVAAGRPIVDGDSATMMTTVLDPRRRPTPRTEGLVVSDTVERVFAQALALDPKARFPTAGEFWDALTSAMDLGGPAPVASRRDPRIDGGRSGSVDEVGIDRASRPPGTGPAAPRVPPPPLPPPAAPRTSSASVSAITQPAARAGTGGGALPPPAPPPARAAPAPPPAEIPDLDLGGPAPAPTPEPRAAAARPPMQLELDEEGGVTGSVSLDLDLGPAEALQPPVPGPVGSRTGSSSGSLAAVRPHGQPTAAARTSSGSLAAVRPGSTSGSHAAISVGATTGSHAAVRASGTSGTLPAVGATTGSHAAVRASGTSGTLPAVGGGGARPGSGRYPVPAEVGDPGRTTGTHAAARAGTGAAGAALVVRPVRTAPPLIRELAPGAVLVALALAAGVVRAVSDDTPPWLKLVATVGMVGGLAWMGWKFMTRPST